MLFGLFHRLLAGNEAPERRHLRSVVELLNAGNLASAKGQDLPVRAGENEARTPMRDVAGNAGPGDVVLEMEVLDNRSAVRDSLDGVKEGPKFGLPLKHVGRAFDGARIIPVMEVVREKAQYALDVAR